MSTAEGGTPPTRARRPKELSPLRRPEYDGSSATAYLPASSKTERHVQIQDGQQNVQQRERKRHSAIPKQHDGGAHRNEHRAGRGEEDHGHLKKYSQSAAGAPWVRLTNSSEHIERIKVAHGQSQGPSESLDTDPHHHGHDTHTLWEELHGNSESSSASPSPERERHRAEDGSKSPPRSKSPSQAFSKSPRRPKSVASGHQKRSLSSVVNSPFSSRPNTRQNNSRPGTRQDSRPESKQVLSSRPSTTSARQRRATTRPGGFRTTICLY
eukprot:2197564-Rhodomonas_salina.1